MKADGQAGAPHKRLLSVIGLVRVHCRLQNAQGLRR